MFDRTIRTYPIGSKLRGTNLYYNSDTGVKDWSGCKTCSICNDRRRVCVRTDGIRNFDRVRPVRLLFIGEAPGATENGTGIPFTGRSGRVLNQIFQYCTTAFEFCITNTICCQPKDVREIVPDNIDEDVSSSIPIVYEYSNFNRQPRQDEIAACQPHIHELVKTFKPQGIVYLGQTARNSYMTNRPNLHLTHPSAIYRLEYKVIPMRKEARKLYDFILDIRGKQT